MASPPTAAPRLTGHGVVYTRSWVVELMLDLAGYCADEDLVGRLAIEPAAGDGSFLIAMVRRLLASCDGQGRPITDSASSLLAYELDPETAELACRSVVQLLAGPTSMSPSSRPP